MYQTPHALEDYAPAATPEQASGRPVLIVAGSLLLLTGLLVLPLWSGSVAVLRYAVPVLALVQGAVLYRWYPVAFIGYAWWLWFLTPFLRRVVDYQAGWQDPNYLMLTPFAVSILAALSLVRYRHQMRERANYPFVLVLCGLAYAYGIGVLKEGPYAASYDLLQWIVPVFFGLHIALSWRDYPALRRCVQRTFLWGVVLMGVYAVLQFYVLPAWDAYWIVQSEIGSVGPAKPLAVRIFSTMNSPMPYAATAMAGLLLLFTLRTGTHLLAAAPGYAGFLLSLVRSAWGGWLVGLGMMALWASGRMRMRLVGILLLGTLLVAPVVTVPEISDALGKRFGTFTNLEEDLSFNARMTLYRKATLAALTNPVGRGLGSAGTAQKVKQGQAQPTDSGLIFMPAQLGWLGVLPYLAGLVLLVQLAWRGRRYSRDVFADVSLAIALGILAQLLFSNALTGVSGVVGWCFLGLSIASYRYHSAADAAAESGEPGQTAPRPLPAA